MKLWKAAKARETTNSRTHEQIVIEDYINEEIKKAAKAGLNRAVIYLVDTPDSTKERISGILIKNGYDVTDERNCMFLIRW